MSGRLPPELDALIRQVLDAAGLELTDGRDEVARELHAHFEDGLARGVSVRTLIDRFGDPGEAGRRIKRTRPRAAARNRGERGRWWMSPSEWRSELLRATRRLGRAPGFAAVVVITLALGVGANTAIFSVLHAVLLEELPYEQPDRLVRVYESTEERGRAEYMRGPVVAEMRGWADVFERMAALYTYREMGADLTDGDVPERVTLLRVSAGYFETLGIVPLAGRTFTDEESYGPGQAGDRTSHGDVAILSHRLWTDRYGASRDVVGQAIELDGSSLRIVGVMPTAFRDPFGSQADVWTPQDLRPGNFNNVGNYYLSGIARLRDGVTPDMAADRLRTLAAGLTAEQPELEPFAPVIRPLQADLVGETRRTMLWILAAAAGLVLLTACVNVANLLFARGLSQDRALALRSALGSGRARLVASILLENGLLAATGGVLGLALGWLGVRSLLTVAPDVLPLVTEVRFGGAVFAFALVVTVVALLVFGLTPALRMSRTAPAEVLRSGDRASTAGAAVRRIRDVLVVLQIASALVLVTGATLLTRSFGGLLDVPLAVEPEGVLTFEVHLPQATYPEPDDRVRFHRELQRRIIEIPGVTAVGATSWLPVNGRYHSWGFYWHPEGLDRSDDDAWYGTDVRTVEGDYFEALGIELLRGAPPSAVDLEAEQVVWVNRELSESVLGTEDPVGQRIWLAGADRRIAGLVEDVPFSARGDVSRKAYVSHVQADDRNWALIHTVRAEGDLGRVREAIRAELATIDPSLVLYRPRPYTDVLATVRAQDRFATLLMGAFGVLALTLSLVGTFGVLSASVAGRTREIGIRMALGADAAGVRRLVLRYAAALTVPGVVLGLVVASIAGRWLESLLFGVGARDAVSFALAAIVFATAAAAAAWLPARRATRVDTVQVLTSD